MTKITLIVGAGAVEDAWKPVIEAIEKTYGISPLVVGKMLKNR